MLIRPKTPEPEPISTDVIHVIFIRGVRYKGNHVGIGTELAVPVVEAKELSSANATEDVKLPADELKDGKKSWKNRR